MKLSETIKRKCSSRLCEKLSSLAKVEIIQVVVRAKDPAALKRPYLIEGADPGKRIEQEQMQRTLEPLTAFVRRLERETQAIRLIDTSWLTHSILVSGQLESITKLADHDDVQSMELNTEINLQKTFGWATSPGKPTIG